MNYPHRYSSPTFFTPQIIWTQTDSMDYYPYDILLESDADESVTDIIPERLDAIIGIGIDKLLNNILNMHLIS